VTVLLICNATGSEKIHLLFIHKYKNPYTFRGISKNTLLVNYYWNLKSYEILRLRKLAAGLETYEIL